MSIRLARKLELQERSGASDGAGGATRSWSTLGTHWAHIEARTGRYERGEGYPRARVPYKITIRAVAPSAVSRPKPGQRFLEGTRVFKIRAVADEDSDARYLVCFADEEVAG